MAPRFTPVADTGLLVSFADEMSADAHAAVGQLDHAVASDPPPGVLEQVPAFVNLLVRFDPLVTDHAALEEALRALWAGAGSVSRPTQERRVEVCYDAEFAPDLPAVAKAVGLSEEEVIAAHLSGDYEVALYGFAPGYAYLTGVPEVIQVPRKPAPVRDIPAGSVMIAAGQCLVTTLKMPTGWSIIGRSPTPILTDDPDRPALFDVGDKVVFERIDRATLEARGG
nr:allophanate hydrolase subunit 1 [Litoreibacter ponti]